MKTTLTFLFIGLFASLTNAQNNFSLRVNSGITTGKDIIDGSYFSFDVGIPITKGLEIAPTFTSASMLPNINFRNQWINDTISPVSYSVPSKGVDEGLYSGASFYSIGLLAYFRPFDFSEKEKHKKHELLIGVGYVFNSYTIINTRYVQTGSGQELESFSVKSVKTFEPYFLKIAYNRIIKENLCVGVVTGLHGFDGEGEILTGFQFGIKF